MVLSASASSRPVIVVTGARQVGKTSLLRKHFSKHHYVSLDLPSLAEQAEKDPELFLKEHPAPCLIDEVQYAPQLFRHIKYVVDQNRNLKSQFILTGSQKFQLMKEVSDSLAGRADILELETLSLSEIRKVSPKISYEEALLKGGYPELHADTSIDPNRFFRSYVSSYIERDVRQILNVAQLRDFERFLRACALRSGQMLNKADLARDVGISPSTANQWLSVLEASNVALLLEPWFANGTKSIVKSPKLYIADTGLLCFLLNITTTSELLKSPQLGAIWETFVFSELRKEQVNHSGHYSLYYWRDRTREVDFVIHRGQRFEIFESKWTENPSPSDAVNLRYFTQTLRAGQVIKSQIICRASNTYPLDEAIEVRSL